VPYNEKAIAMAKNPHYSSDNLAIDSAQFAINLQTRLTPSKPIAEYNF